MDTLKNPILIGLISGALIYGYLVITTNEKNKKKSKKDEKDKVNLLIPLVVGVIVWFLTYAYFDYNSNSNNIIKNDGIKNVTLPLPLKPASNYNFIKDIISESSEPEKFSLVTTGTKPPIKIPDVLLQMH
jgi:hypothetical protein